MSNKDTGVMAAGLALFSMFFGAGDLIWPLILGGGAGDKNFYAMMGLLITGVSLPLLGLLAMMLFEGNYRAFFARIGSSSFMLVFIIQMILGPLGSIPRCITLSFATIKPYLPNSLSLWEFSLAISLLILAFTIKPQRIVGLLGLILTPLLLISLGAILLIGFYAPPVLHQVSITSWSAFHQGLETGYNTLDLIASFIFAPLVLSHFCVDKEDQGVLDPQYAQRRAFKKMIKASLLAAFLLSMMYIGLTYVAAYYTPYLDPTHAREERLSAIAMHLLGSQGALIACVAVAMACLTTAIAISSIFAKYLHEDIFQKKGGMLLPLLLTLAVSSLIANMGFMGIAGMLSPILEILCPGLIVLSVINMIDKLYEKRMSRTPVLATFALSTIGHVIRLAA